MRNWSVVRGVLMAVCVALATAVTYAAPADPVTIEVRGVPSGSALQVVVHAANGIKTLESPTSPVASDLMSDGKAVTTYIDTCKGKVFVNIVEQGGLPPPEEENCNRKVIAGWLWGPGKRMVIDAGRGVIADSQSVALRNEGARASWSPYASVNWGGASFSNANAAVETLTGRYQAANYTQSSATVDRSDTTIHFDAGVRFRLSDHIGLETGGGYGRWGGASLDSNGTRTLGDLRFTLDSSFTTSQWTAQIGVPISFLDRLEFVPEVGSGWWHLQQAASDFLSSMGQQVRGGTTTSSRDGRDWFYGVKARMMRNRWGIEFGYRRLELKDAFEANASTGWPTNVVRNEWSGGAVLFPFGR